MTSINELVVKNSAGYWWPRLDGNGNYEGEGSCWAGNFPFLDTPELVTKFVPEPLVCIQAGGNCGPFVKKYAELFQLVYTFEPDPVNFFCLTLNVPELHVLKYQACLGAEHSPVAIARNFGDVGSTHVHGNGVVPTMLIDDLNPIRCDLIHLDIEGYELNALQGGIETIKKFKPIIVVEVCEEWAARYNSSTAQVHQFLLSLGYNEVGKAHNDVVYKHTQA